MDQGLGHPKRDSPRNRSRSPLLPADAAPLAAVLDGMPVLVTGHTGFKGSWLSIWLRELGAQVIGYSLAPPTTPSNFAASCLAQRIADVRGDVRDLVHLRDTVATYQPQVIFHLAAQPLVLPSYRQPKETFDVNVGGTVNVLEAVRTAGCVRAAICITTDKVYKNREWPWGYREIDELGGHDPYSASKAMAELAVVAYRHSFFEGVGDEKAAVAVATARAGNVFGGGDWGAHRLVPDCVRGLIEGKPIHLRNPSCVRPWQILLEPLSGYLWLAAKLLGQDGTHFAQAWNLGPAAHEVVTTEEVVQEAIRLWGTGSYTKGTAQQEVETQILRLNSDQAAQELGWHAIYGWKEALSETIAWFKTYAQARERAEPVDMYPACVEQIARYTERAAAAGLPWAGAAPEGRAGDA